MTSAPTPPHDWVDIFKALLTPVIAIVAVGIAFAQWWTAKQRLRLELFDRRWKVYMAIREFVSEMKREVVVSSDTLNAFRQDVRACRWLFDEEVERYVQEELWKRAIELKSARESIVNQHGDAYEAALKEADAIKDWLGDQDAVIDNLFGTFLSVAESFRQVLVRSLLRSLPRHVHITRPAAPR